MTRVVPSTVHSTMPGNQRSRAVGSPTTAHTASAVRSIVICRRMVPMGAWPPVLECETIDNATDTFRGRQVFPAVTPDGGRGGLPRGLYSCDGQPPHRNRPGGHRPRSTRGPSPSRTRPARAAAAARARRPQGRADRQLRARREARARRHRRPGTIRHIWMTFPPAPPERHARLWSRCSTTAPSRAQHLRPGLDFFGLPHGRPVAVRLGADRRAGRSRLQRLLPDAVPRAHPHRADQRLAAADGPLLPGRLHAAADAAGRRGLPPRRVPPREPDHA